MRWRDNGEEVKTSRLVGGRRSNPENVGKEETASGKHSQAIETDRKFDTTEGICYWAFAR